MRRKKIRVDFFAQCGTISISREGAEKPRKDLIDLSAKKMVG